MPQTPTFSQSGMPGFELTVWHGLYAPKGTPKPVIARLVASLGAALKDPVLAQRFNEMDAMIVPPSSATPTYLAKFLKSDVERWKVALKNAGIKPE